MQDRKLIQQIQRGNKELLNTIIDKYYDEILHFCIYQIKDVSASYDLTQEPFYRFIRSVDYYLGASYRAAIYFQWKRLGHIQASEAGDKLTGNNCRK